MYAKECKFSHDPEQIAAALENGELENDHELRPKDISRHDETCILLWQIPPHWQAHDIIEHFEQYGTVLDARVINGQDKGSVTFQSPAVAQEVAANIRNLPPVEGCQMSARLRCDVIAQRRRRDETQRDPRDRDPEVTDLKGVIEMLGKDEKGSELISKLLDKVDGEESHDTLHILAKVDTHEDLEISVQHDLWHVSASNADLINGYLAQGKAVILIFSVRGSDSFSGYANVKGDTVLRSERGAEVKTLPLSWERVLDVEWGSVAPLKFAECPPSAAAAGDGDKLPHSDGEKIITLITQLAQTAQVVSKYVVFCFSFFWCSHLCQRYIVHERAFVFFKANFLLPTSAGCTVRRFALSTLFSSAVRIIFCYSYEACFNGEIVCTGIPQEDLCNQRNNFT